MDAGALTAHLIDVANAVEHEILADPQRTKLLPASALIFASRVDSTAGQLQPFSPRSASSFECWTRYFRAPLVASEQLRKPGLRAQCRVFYVDNEPPFPPVGNGHVTFPQSEARLAVG